uniref:Cyclin D3 n=1 Tax=Salvator merianae TaxID=96440 RepID=A0A8D0BZ59_SALMN
MNYVNRYLSCAPVPKKLLQLLGAVCILLASKLREMVPLTVEKLCIYTDYSVTAREVLDWETLVLQKLKWDLAAVIPNDFLDYVLCWIPLPQAGAGMVKRRAQTFMALCATGTVPTEVEVPFETHKV